MYDRAPRLYIGRAKSVSLSLRAGKDFSNQGRHRGFGQLAKIASAKEPERSASMLKASEKTKPVGKLEAT